jgi:hypothetical protein
MPTYAVLPVDMIGVLSNTMTVITSTNHRPARLRNVGVDVLRGWRDRAVVLAGKDHREDLAAVFRGDANVGRNGPISLFMNEYGEVAALLASEPGYVRDVGVNLSEHLLKSGNWSTQTVSTPALGYPRTYLQCSARYLAKNSPFSLPGTSVTSRSVEEGLTPPTAEGDESDRGQNDTFAQTCADLAMLFDRPNYSIGLIPEAKTLTQRNVKEPFWGETQAVMGQLRRLNAIGLLYASQADALALRWDESMWTFAYTLAWEQYIGMRPLLEMMKKMRDELLAMLPCHPLLETTRQLVKNVTLETFNGTRDAYVRHVPNAGAALGISPTDGGREALGPVNNSVLAMRLVATAMAEFGRLGEIAASGVEWPKQWLDEAGSHVGEDGRKAILTSSRPGGAVLFSDALHRLSALKQYTEQWPDITRILNWGTSYKEVSTTIHAHGADFTVTDGDGWSNDPISTVAGLKPSVSIGNPKSAAIAVRFQNDFGTGLRASTAPQVREKDGMIAPAAFEWNVVTVEGHLTALDGNETLTRFYMPPGMLMGEIGGEARFATGDEPNHVAVKRLYESKSPGGYTRQWALVPEGAPSIARGDNLFIKTDWDGWTQGTDPVTVQRLLLDQYGSSEVDENPDVFLFRESWKMRVPVKLTRANCYEEYDELGAFRKTVPFEGYVLFDGEDLDVGSYGTSSVQTLVDMLLVKPAEGLVSEEAKAPIDPTVE